MKIRARLSILNRRIRRAINVIADPSAVSPMLYKAFIRGYYLSIDLPVFFLSLSLSLSGSCPPFLPFLRVAGERHVYCARSATLSGRDQPFARLHAAFTSFDKFREAQARKLGNLACSFIKLKCLWKD